MDDFHKRSTKKNQVERVLKHFEKRRSPDDRKRLEEKRRQRKAGLGGRKRPRDDEWLEMDEDEELLFEKMTPSHVLLPGTSRDRTAEGGSSTGFVSNPVEGPTATVVNVAASKVHVELAGEVVEARLHPVLLRHQVALAVGDVALIGERDGPPRVEAIVERRTWLSRPDPGNVNKTRVLAANVDLALLVLSAKDPAFKPGLTDRVRVATARGGVELAVCVNKVDLLTTAERDEVESVLARYVADGRLVSSASGEGLSGLRELMSGKTVVFLGHSGVGKSSLLNAIDPAGERAVGAVRSSDGKGKHTTTSSTLTNLEGGARVIDTPGVRKFGLSRLSSSEVREAFPEIEALRVDCRFRDCTHLVEPECRVRAAVEAGELAETRHAAYARLFRDCDD